MKAESKTQSPYEMNYHITYLLQIRSNVIYLFKYTIVLLNSRILEVTALMLVASSFKPNIN